MNEQEKVSLTDDELVVMLDARIRDCAKWRIRDAARTGGVGSTLVNPTKDVDPEDVSKVALEVYDSVISDFSYNDNVVKAARALGAGKFTAKYCEKVIKKALKSGAITLESVVVTGLVNDTLAEMDGQVIESRGRKLKVRK